VLNVLFDSVLYSNSPELPSVFPYKERLDSVPFASGIVVDVLFKT
jgi:hypothetical protein